MSALRPVIVAGDVVTAYGSGLDACWQGLLAGRSAVSRFDRFPTQAFVSDVAATVPELDPARDESLVMQMLDPLLAAARNEVPADARVLLASSVGEIDLLERNILRGSGGPDNSRLACLLDRVCRRLGVREQGVVVSAACASATMAVAHGASLIRRGERDAVCVVACDAVTEFVYSGFSALMALDRAAARPFDRNRSGLNLGDGAGFVLLMSPERAAREKRRVYGEIAGWGATGDANHMTGPSRDGAALAAAVRAALAAAGAEAGEIGSISAHGTGTSFNDAMEMKAFRLLFGENPVPIYSIKGGTGHTLGAAGLIEMLVELKALAAGIVPPTVNLREPDADAAGWVSGQAVQRKSGPVGLTTNSGFGGVNVALALVAG